MRQMALDWTLSRVVKELVEKIGEELKRVGVNQLSFGRSNIVS